MKSHAFYEVRKYFVNNETSLWILQKSFWWYCYWLYLNFFDDALGMIHYNTWYFTECESGTYGRKCENSCGHCVNQTDCFHINGTCLKGCGTGYLGNECKTGNV